MSHWKRNKKNKMNNCGYIKKNANVCAMNIDFYTMIISYHIIHDMKTILLQYSMRYNL